MDDAQEKVILSVIADESMSTYRISACPGSSVNEMAFAVMIVIKALIRDGFIKNKRVFDRLVSKYYQDSQYSEVLTEEA